MPLHCRALPAVLLAACIPLIPIRSFAATEALKAWTAASDTILAHVGKTGQSPPGPPALGNLSSTSAAGTLVTLSRAGRTRACQGSLHPEAATLDEEAVRLARA